MCFTCVSEIVVMKSNVAGAANRRWTVYYYYFFSRASASCNISLSPTLMVICGSLFLFPLSFCFFFFRVLQVSVALIPYMRAFGLLAASGSLTPPLNSVKGISSVLELSGWLAVYLFFNRLLLSLGLLSVVVSLGTFVVEAVTSIIESSAIFSHPLYICYNIHFANLIVWVSPSSLGCLD